MSDKSGTRGNQITDELAKNISKKSIGPDSEKLEVIKGILKHIFSDNNWMRS